MIVRVLALVLLSLPSLAAAAVPARLALLPLRDASLGPTGARIEAALVDAAQSLPGFVVVNFNGTRLAGPRKVDARMETQPSARALALGKEVNAQRAVAAEATPLGEGLVVYLQAIEVPSGRTLASTTVPLGGGAARAPGDRDVLRGALVRILAADRFIGHLQVRLDVQGAEVQIDGHPAHAGLVELPVGTHALRVTHPAYHDFLRFLDVEFDKTQTVDVNMALYPLAEGEMTERQRRGLAPSSQRRVPWWRTWWALSGAGIVITGVTVGAVVLARPGLPHDDGSAAYRPTPTP